MLRECEKWKDKLASDLNPRIGQDIFTSHPVLLFLSYSGCFLFYCDRFPLIFFYIHFLSSFPPVIVRPDLMCCTCVTLSLLSKFWIFPLVLYLLCLPVWVPAYLDSASCSCLSIYLHACLPRHIYILNTKWKCEKFRLVSVQSATNWIDLDVTQQTLFFYIHTYYTLWTKCSGLTFNGLCLKYCNALT